MKTALHKYFAAFSNYATLDFADSMDKMKVIKSYSHERFKKMRVRISPKEAVVLYLLYLVPF